MRKLSKRKSGEIRITDQIKRKTNFVSMATDTLKLTWNICKRGREDKKILKRERRLKIQSNIYLSFKIRTIRTWTHNSIRDDATNRRPHKHGNVLFICKGERGRRRIEDQHQVTYRIIMYSLEGAIYPVYYRSIISAHHSENTFRNIVSLRFRCLASIFFLSRDSQINCFTSGVQSFKTIGTVSQGIIYYTISEDPPFTEYLC